MGLIGGRYERLHRIASGGMATVYLGRAHGFGVGGFERPVAIKAMHPHLAEDAEFVSMFLDEAKLAASIRHANVVATLDAVRDHTGLFLVMEYVEGLALSGLTKSARRHARQIPAPVALRILVDALAGLHAAHELKGPDGRLLNVIHRDVSPHNVLVGVDGTARIADFGIARAEARSATTRTGQVKGKTAYMSIEQLHAQPLDRRSDVYSAGILLWELLVGRRLFDGESEGAIAALAARGTSQAPHEIDPAVARPLSLACMRALALDPARRWDTAAAFADAIEDAAAASNVAIARAKEVGRFVTELSPEARVAPSTAPAAAPPIATPAPPSESSRSDAGPPSKTSPASTLSVRTAPVRPRLWAIALPAAVVGIGGGYLMFRLFTPPTPEASVDPAPAAQAAASPREADGTPSPAPIAATQASPPATASPSTSVATTPRTPSAAEPKKKTDAKPAGPGAAKPPPGDPRGYQPDRL